MIIIFTLIIGSLYPLEIAIETIYSSLIFRSLLGVLLLSLIICLLANYKTLRGKQAFVLIHFSLIIIFIGSFISVVFSEKAIMQLNLFESSNIATKSNNDKLLLPFNVKLNSFNIEKYSEKQELILAFLDHNLNEISSYKVVEGHKYKIPLNQSELNILKISETSTPESNNVNIKLGIKSFTRWVTANNTAYLIDEENKIYLIFLTEENMKNIKGYKSDIEVIKNNITIKRSTIEVNKPLQIDGYKFYQYSYDSQHKSWSGIMVKKDPGVLIVFAGYLIFVIGVLVNLFVNLKKPELFIHND